MEKVLKQGQVDEESSELESDLGSEQDIILEEFGTESKPDAESDHEQQQTINDPVPLIVQTRFGVIKFISHVKKGKNM